MYIIFDDNPTCNEKQLLEGGNLFIISYKNSVGSMFRGMNVDFGWDFRTAFQIVGTIKGGGRRQNIALELLEAGIRFNGGNTVKRFKKMSKALSICLTLALLFGMVPLSSASALTDDFILFDFTEKEIMKESKDAEEGIFWTAPTDADGHQTFRFVENAEDGSGSYYEFTNADGKDDPFFMGTLGDRSFSSDYKFVKMMYRTESKGTQSLYFWGSDETPLGGNTSESFTKVCDGKWNTVVTEIVNKTWSGTIEMFRLNTIKSGAKQGDTFDLKYIALFKTREEAEAYEFIKGANFVIDKSVYNIGDQIDVSYLDTADGDWFGIFKQGEDPATAEPILRKEAGAADKVQSFTFEGDAAKLPLGEYTIYLLDAQNQVLRQRSFSVIQMADYSKLEAILAQVEDHSYYTDETIAAFEEALAKVEYDRPANEQDKIDEQIAAVEAAFKKLVLKEADYWDVRSAIAKIPGDLTVYTAGSVGALQQAQQKVNWNKKMTEQDTVDGYAKAIYAAIDNLVRKDGAISTNQNFSKVNGSLAGVDDLGRELPMNDTVPNSREGERYVGLFYFLWQGQHGTGGPYDNSKIEKVEGAVESEENWIKAGGGPVGAHHFWGEPLFGYYTSDDEWVMRKHVQMLTDADVDFLVFDTTNAVTYTAQALKLMKILDEYQKQGWDVPQVACYTNSSSGNTMDRIYNDIYKAHPEYEKLWFNWDGKPLIIGNASEASKEVKEFFRIKANQWPTESKVDDGFPWMEFSRSLTDSSVYGLNGRREVMNVSIAQHASTTRFSATAWYGANDRSRSWHDGANDTSEGAVNMGYNFAEQWEYAISKDPEMIFITGWNEWVAQRQPVSLENEPIFFVDCANQNCSRDAEPMKDGHGDNYYMQMMDYIRQYKGTDPKVDVGENQTIDVNGSFDQWNSAKITANYEDYVGDTADRDAKGFGELEYKNTTGRNDIQNMKVARDFDNLYFYVDTVDDITKPAGDHWMTLFLNTGSEKHANWKGYDYVLNRVAPEGGKAVLEKYDGENWAKVATVDMKVEGNQLMVAVPRDLLDVGTDLVDALDLQFKWADNYQEEQDIWTFYEDGDVAPYGRLNYVFSGADEAQEEQEIVEVPATEEGSVHNDKLEVAAKRAAQSEVTNKVVTEVDAENPGTVEARVFAALKGVDKELVINANSAEGLAYSWYFNGLDITDDSIDVALKVTVNAGNTAITDQLPDKDNSVIVSFEHQGKLPGKANVTVLVGEKYAGKTLYAYRYDAEKNQFVKMDPVAVDENGYAVLPITEGADYVLTVEKLEQLVPPESDPDSKPEEGGENHQTGESAALPVAVLALGLAGGLSAYLLVRRKRLAAK